MVLERYALSVLMRISKTGRDDKQDKYQDIQCRPGVLAQDLVNQHQYQRQGQREDLPE
jgi:hypothetical protein